MVKKRTVAKRKKRSDCLHILYQLTLVETGQTYIGLSRMNGRSSVKALAERWRRHNSRAKHEDKGWALHLALRAYPDPNSWTKVVLRTVRGRAEAHTAERKLIRLLAPELNTF